MHSAPAAGAAPEHFIRHYLDVDYRRRSTPA